MSNGGDTAKQRRWRPWQFSLRFLMLVMFGVATFTGGWVANDWNRKRTMKAPQGQTILIKTIITTRPERPNKVIQMHDPVDLKESPRRHNTTLINDLSN